jgi:DNA-binding beta-propeller fold protein YncE
MPYCHVVRRRQAGVTWCVTLAVGLVAVGLVGLAPAVASPRAPAPYVLSTRIHVGRDPRMLYAHGKLFVSSGSTGSDVMVYSPAGTLLHTITDQPGAEGMVPSADGKTLYVADSSGDQISAIDTTTYATTEFTVDSCPTNVALASGRLFYSFGCSYGADTSGVANIDPTTGRTPVEDAALSMLYAPPLLAGAGSVLASIGVGVEPTALQTFTASDAGGLTQMAAQSDDNSPSDLAISSDGDHLYVANDITGFTKYATSTLDQEATYNADSFTAAVALSPAGTRLAGGFGAYSDIVALYSTSSSTALWQRIGASTSTTTWARGVSAGALPGTLTFSSDGDQVYGLMSAPFSTYPLLFSSAVTTSATSLHLSVRSSTADHPVSATATMSTPGKVIFKGVSDGVTHSLGTVMTNSKGVAALRFRSAFNGAVHAVFDGSLTNYPTTSAASYKISSKTSLRLSGSYATRRGVRLFHSTKQVRLLGKVTPAVLNRAVTASLQYDRHGTWHVVGSLDDSLLKNGTVKLRLGISASLTLTRIELRFRGDRLNTGSEAFSPTFEIT